MKWQFTAWLLVKDILMTGTGIFLIIEQGLRPQPSYFALGAGISLVIPAAVSKLMALWSAPFEAVPGVPESSLPARPPGAPGSPSSSSEGTDED